MEVSSSTSNTNDPLARGDKVIDIMMKMVYGEIPFLNLTRLQQDIVVSLINQSKKVIYGEHYDLYLKREEQDKVKDEGYIDFIRIPRAQGKTYSLCCFATMCFLLLKDVNIMYNVYSLAQTEKIKYEIGSMIGKFPNEYKIYDRVIPPGKGEEYSFQGFFNLEFGKGAYVNRIEMTHRHAEYRRGQHANIILLDESFMTKEFMFSTMLPLYTSNKPIYTAFIYTQGVQLGELAEERLRRSYTRYYCPFNQPNVYAL